MSGEARGKSDFKAEGVEVRHWEWNDDRFEAEKIKLSVGKLSLVCTSLGAHLLSLKYPNASGTAEELTLNLDTTALSPSEFLKQNTVYYGATVGRYANRIAKGEFKLGGKRYKLAQNNGTNCLHGGEEGFDKRNWAVEVLLPSSGDKDFVKGVKCVGVKFSRVSQDMEEGFPGKLEVEVKYVLTEEDELHMVYRATTDKTTVVNLTNHTYWNLSGDCKRGIAHHGVQLFCSSYLPQNDDQVPTGVVQGVKGTPFDLRKELHEVGPSLAKVDGGGMPGFDHCFVVDGSPGTLRPVASVREYESGRSMEISSNQAGVQLYTANFLPTDGDKAPHIQHNAMCFETQAFPDSPNQPKFPTVVLKPGQKYFHHTKHRFAIVK